MSKLSFEEWYLLNEEETNIELAESGADREMGFDVEREFEERFQKYLEHTEATSKYDYAGNLIFYEMVRGFWYKWDYDDRGNKIRQEDRNGFWWVAEYDEDNHQTYYEDMHGCVIGFRKGHEHVKKVNKALNSNVQGWCPFLK